MIFAEVTGHHHVTGGTENRKVSGYRRWGFESVRKGDCRADARLQSFENGLFCCKLTVGFRGWNLWLHVSLGAVGSWSFAVFRKSFSLSVGFTWVENANFFRKQKLFFSKWPCINRKSRLFRKTKRFLLQKTFLTALKSCLFYAQKFSLSVGFAWVENADFFCNQKAFLLQVVLHELKNPPFSQTENVFICRKPF